ncbi:hypothetical protein EDB86DRAFT_3076991 [Lactarius hatsudake]|nr:hypothetical protein EDB86DRAFT_3076991 [Lactarius hatsudake]
MAPSLKASPPSTGETASTMDKLTKCALEAQVSAANVDHKHSNKVKQEEGVLSVTRIKAQARTAEADADANSNARADAEVTDEFAQETSRRRQEIQRIAGFGYKAVFVPTEVMDVASQVVAGVGVDSRT